jgi:DNA segregation ATPase FtsK/SpoIIIE, S-DNA-T family
VNRPLDLAGTLDLLDDLAKRIGECRAGADRLKAEAQRRFTRLDQEQRQSTRELEHQLAEALAEAEAASQHDRQRIVMRHDRRLARLANARQAAQDRRATAIKADESRVVFRVQRELLQVNRDREAAKQHTDAARTAFQTQWEQEREAVDRLDRTIERSFQGYRVFCRLLVTPAEAPTPLPSADDGSLLAECRTLRVQAEQDAARFRRLPLPRWFSLFSPWLLAGLAVALHVLAAVLLPLIGQPSVSWDRAALSLGATLAAILLLHLLGRQTAWARAGALARAILRVRTLLEGAHAAAEGRRRQELQRVETEAQIRTETLQAEWRGALTEAQERTAALHAQLEQRSNRLRERIESSRHRALARIEEDRERTTAGLRETTATQRRRAETETAAARAQAEAAQERDWETIANEWQTRVTGAYLRLAAAAEAAHQHFPAWTDPVWESWSPPSELRPEAPFGRLAVDLARCTGGLPEDPRLVLPGPPELQLPLLLALPGQGSMLLTTQDQGRGTALATLNHLVLRWLLNAPPGRVLFTILDPVGLGESFAGLMHLTDHEDRLINRRIWTQPDHIEQRLADLNEHIEKVTQLYLRNEYRTIAEYNAQAGRIAEPYHFLVIADFPVNFSDLAVRRLLSIATSGPRCGVFTLVHWDTRKPAPLEFVAEDLRQASVELEARAGAFVLAGRSTDGMTLALDSPPPAPRMTALLQAIGRSSIDSNRVEMPFAQIAPGEGELWSRETTVEVRVPIGVTGATKLQHLSLGKGTRQHVLIAGKTGSGKSTLFHVLISNLALWFSPDQVEFYLVDFKKGVEFKCYATNRLAHARVVAIESDREFGLSVLQRVDVELHRRGDLFRQLGAQDLAAHRRAGGQPLPRTLLIIDEFQEFFTEDDRVSQQAALLLDRLVRQGRAFGIHVLLGSQTLGGAYTLARTTLGQMVVRIALQCSPADALLIMDDDNPAPRLLSRPGEAIYNDAAGAIEGNSPFQIVWLSEAERQTLLRQLRERADATGLRPPDPVVFEGNAPAGVQDNTVLRELLEHGPSQPAPPARIWLGAPNAIKGPTEALLQRQNGHNLLVVGQNDEAALALLGLSLIALAAQHPPGTARLILCDASPPGSPPRRFLEQITNSIPQEVTLAGNADLGPLFLALAEELSARAAEAPTAATPSVYLCLHHLQRFKALRYEDEFSLSLDESSAAAPGAVLNRILTEGTHLGWHVLCTTDSYNNASRFLGRKALNEFELRVLFQMSASDSASLMDDPRASALGLHRAILFNLQEGTAETFRPYALPDAAWIEAAGRRLAQRRG